MESTSGAFQGGYRFVFLAMMLLLKTSALSNAVTEKKDPNSIPIPLKLSGKSDANQPGWKITRFRNKPSNKIISDKDGLHIAVECSANLLTYCLNKPTDVNGILLRGSVTGLPKIEENKQQGDKNTDDFALRFGLVVSGTKKLGPLDKLFAPELVKRLCELAPASQGIDHVLFLNLANDPPPKWNKRIHPIGKGLLQEQICGVEKGPGNFIMKAAFKQPYTVLALCIISDGDDTKSKYQVTVSNIQLNPESDKICPEIT